MIKFEQRFNNHINGVPSKKKKKNIYNRVILVQTCTQALALRRLLLLLRLLLLQLLEEGKITSQAQHTSVSKTSFKKKERKKPQKTVSKLVSFHAPTVLAMCTVHQLS